MRPSAGCLVLGCVAVFVQARESPSVFWWSAPVEPGDLAVLTASEVLTLTRAPAKP